jgi:hypothetical protein
MPDDAKIIRRKILRKLIYWRSDIVDFVETAFAPVEITDQQREVLLSIQKPGAKVAVKAGHGVAKTCTEAWVALWGVLCHFDVRVPVTGPSAPQLRDVFMAELTKWKLKLRPWLEAQIEITSMGAHVTGRKKLQFISVRTSRREDPTALQGFHAPHVLFICDEAFGIPDQVFEAAEGALTKDTARLLLCGNPTSLTGYAYDAFHKNKRLFVRHTLSCVDAPEWLVSRTYINEMKEKYGEDSDIYKYRVLGEFPSASAAQLIPNKLVEEAAGRHLREDEYNFAPVILGVDVARFGDDRSVIFLRQGLMAKELGSWYNIDTVDLSEKVMYYADECRADAIMVDVIGIGSGVVDNLIRVGRDPISINFSGSAMKPKYYNKRAECWGEMKNWLALGGSIPKSDDLSKELVAVVYGFTGAGKLQLEAKRDVKKRLGFSPDKADALALTFGSPVLSNKRDLRQLLRDLEQFVKEETLDVLNEREHTLKY